MPNETTLLLHEKLIAWQVACELLRVVRDARIADLGLRDQAMRAAQSACLNIAEANGRVAPADRRRVFAIARGEATEAAAAVQVRRLQGNALSVRLTKLAALAAALPRSCPVLAAECGVVFRCSRSDGPKARREAAP